jgi:hypothetical protein
VKAKASNGVVAIVDDNSKNMFARAGVTAA